jgi:hypothetical protein
MSDFAQATPRSIQQLHCCGSFSSRNHSLKPALLRTISVQSRYILSWQNNITLVDFGQSAYFIGKMRVHHKTKYP